MCEVLSKLTMKAPERLTDFTHCSGVSIVDFEQINSAWVVSHYKSEDYQ